ncbi:hypothetical protein Lal_00033509 [Lupinus albus]|nr:hypothetical protein Lal_00033509 [Lupinus albus]
MVSHILERDPTYPKQVREEEEELETREESSGSRSSEPVLAQARKSRLFKISDLTLSLKRGFLAQARISQSQHPQNAISRPGENPLGVKPRIIKVSWQPPRLGWIKVNTVGAANGFPRQ